MFRLKLVLKKIYEPKSEVIQSLPIKIPTNYVLLAFNNQQSWVGFVFFIVKCGVVGYSPVDLASKTIYI